MGLLSLSRTGDDTLEMVRPVVDRSDEYVAGIGLDDRRTAGPPERSAAA